MEAHGQRLSGIADTGGNQEEKSKGGLKYTSVY